MINANTSVVEKERTCGDGPLPCGSVCISTEIGPFVNFPA